MACIYIYWREENNNNNSYPNLNMMYIDVPVFWNITSSPAPTSSTSPTRNWSTSFFFSSLSGIPRQRMESYICIEIFFLGSATLLQRAATHLSGIFHGIFSTIEKDTTKSLGLRGIRVLEPTPLLQSNREETNANGGTKWRQISKTSKKSYKIGVRRNQKIPSRKVIAWCLDLNEKIMIRYGHFISKNKARKTTSREVSGLKILFVAN